MPLRAVKLPLRTWPIAIVAAGMLGACGGGGGGGVSTPLPAFSPIGYSTVLTTVLPGGHTPRRVATGFFDGDAYPDIAVAHSLESGVSVLLGRGDGTFETVAPITAGLPGLYTKLVRTAFLDLDPFTDLVVVDNVENTVQTYLGRGDGTFDPVFAVPLEVSGTDMHDVAVGPFDGDVLDDVVFVTDTGVHVYLATGGGNLVLAAGSPYLAAEVIRSVHVAQTDSGAPLDLVLCSPTTGLVHILRGNSLGGFTVSPMSPVSVPEGPYAAVIASIDGFGGPDLVVLTQAPGFRVFLGTGDVVFTPTAQGHGGLVGNVPAAAAVVLRPRPNALPQHDDVILLTATFAPQQFSLHVTRIRPQDDATGNVTRASQTSAGPIASEVSVFDADQDGEPDLLLPLFFPEPGHLLLLLGD